MNVGSRTTEGRPGECPVCGKKVWIEPSEPGPTQTCPHCGCLLWLPNAPDLADVICRLEKFGASVETDDQGEIQAVKFSGSDYNDAVLWLLRH